MTDWRIGCSGFHYKEWKELFYPAGLPQKKWLEYYCRQFNTLEINSSFYRQPTLKSFQNWYEQSPPGFLFSVKAPRTITHYKKFNDAREELDVFYDTMSAGLKDKLGAVLFQMPPGFFYTAARLELVISSMRKGFENVLEARHASWWNDKTFHRLAEESITFSGISYPSALPDTVIKAINPVYYRFHGRPVLYKSEYAIDELKRVIDEIGNGPQRVYVYFNNTWGGAALKNARQFIKLAAIDQTP